MTVSIALYDQSNINALPFPETEDGDYARRYLLPMVRDGVRTYIDNAHTDLRVLLVDDVVLPITVTGYHPANSYVISPYNHYIGYALEVLEKIFPPPVAALNRALLHAVGWYFKRARLDDVVFVNNWLLSTNLYPTLTARQVEAVTDFLVRRFPDRPVVWRSVDDYANADLYGWLCDSGHRMVFCRQIYYQQPEVSYRRNDFKRDRNLYRHGEYAFVTEGDLTLDDVPRLRDLYNALYIRKYTLLNPQFTEAFFRLVLENRLLYLRGLRKDGRLDGVMGYFVRRGIMTQPVVGYDTGLPLDTGLYRMLSMKALVDAGERGLLLNNSSGVGMFKRLRGGVAVDEYNAVYDRHLPAWRRHPWTLLKVILERVAMPIIHEKEL